MDLIDFLNVFDKIKPSLEEIKASDIRLTDDIVSELVLDYDLKAFSMTEKGVLLIDILFNTNLSDLYFSCFVFEKPVGYKTEFQICKIMERDISIFYNAQSEEVVVWKSFSGQMNRLLGKISQSVFVFFLLKYWEFEFNRVFRKGKPLQYTKDLIFENHGIMQLLVFSELLKESNISIDYLK